MQRRLFLCSGLLAALVSSAQAQTSPAQPVTISHLGVFSLLGDSVQVTVSTDAPTDTRLERTTRETMPFKGIGFDLIALKSVREAAKKMNPSMTLTGYRSPQELSVNDQRSLADGATRAELPGWMVGAINDKKLSHLIIVSRTRGAISARTGDGDGIGRGTVEGIGFYLDTLFTMKNTETGAVSTGLLAPYTQINMILMDAQSGEVLGQYNVREALAYASKDGNVEADPWRFMTTEEKTLSLRTLVAKGIDRGMESLMTPR